MTLILFQFIQVVVLLGFLFFISDLRKKEELFTKSRSVPFLMWIISAILAIGYFFIIVFIMQSISIFDQIALLLTILGTFCIIRSRYDLGSCKNREEFVRSESLFVKNGIYRYLRHPMYFGAFLFIFGALFTIIFHTPIWFGAIMVILAASILAFIILSAQYEELTLREKFGNEYLIYYSEVRAVFPVRKSHKSKGSK